MAKLKALRPLCGDYGSVSEGQTFETDEKTALSLESRGLAERVREPSLVQRMIGKMLGPPENKMMPMANNKADPVVIAPQVIVEPEPPPVMSAGGSRRRGKL
jgi:hypothetical protein